MTSKENINWESICSIEDIMPNTGVCALHNNKQIAIFRVKDQTKQEKLFALENFDPFSEANILSRGIVGNIKEKIVVASPVYKQHFELETGACLEDESVSLATFPVMVKDGLVHVAS